MLRLLPSRSLNSGDAIWRSVGSGGLHTRRRRHPVSNAPTNLIVDLLGLLDKTE